MDIEDVNRASYLSNFEQKIVDYGLGIQHVFADEDEPCFSYTVGLFEHDHPELICFGLSSELAGAILNDLAFRVIHGELRLSGDTRVHQLLQGTHAYLVAGVDRERDYLGTAYSIRARRYPDLAHLDLELLQVAFSDPAGRFPWDAGSDYADWPLFGQPPSAEVKDLTLVQDVA